MLDQIKEAGQEKAVVSFVGVGSAFAKKNSQCSLIISKKGKTILVDIGTTIPTTLAANGIAIGEFDYYHFTHSHADHVGGLEELLLLSRYVLKKQPKVIITDIYQTLLWEHTLKGGCEHNEYGLSRFSHFAEPIRPTWIKAQPREMYHIHLNDMDLNLTIFRTKHIPSDASNWEQSFWSTGLMIDNRILYTCDTRFDYSLFYDLAIMWDEQYIGGTGSEVTINPLIELIFHDCQLFPNTEVGGGVHSSYDELKTLPAELRAKMFLHHYGDNFEQFNPDEDGFKGFAKAWEIYGK